MRIRKRTCHITVIVSRFTPEQLARLRTADTQSGRVRTSSGAADARRRRVERSRALETQRRVAEEAAEQDHDHDHDGQPHDHEGHDHDHDHDHEGHDHDDDERDLDETGPYGPGSAEPLEDGSAPEGYDIKGNADSMLYHVPGGRYYGATKAEVYFATVEDAEDAGFAAPGAAAQSDTDGDDAEEGAE
jgi:hypothetical protein